jgi:hypothetical protein
VIVPLELVQLVLGILRTHKGDVLSHAGMAAARHLFIEVLGPTESSRSARHARRSHCE